MSKLDAGSAPQDACTLLCTCSSQQVDPVEAHMFHGMPVDVRSGTFTLVRNFHQFGLIGLPSGEFIATESLARDISKLARVELRPVKVKWYRFAYSPGGGEWRDHEITGMQGLDRLELHEIIMRLYEQFGDPDCHAPPFFQVVPLNLYKLSHCPDDVIDLKIDMPGYFSIFTDRYSRSLVSEYGLVWSGVFLLSPRVAKLVIPYTNNAFFSHQPLRLP